MEDVKAAGPSRLLSEMVNSVVEIGLDVMIDLINKIIAEVLIPTEWELSIFCNEKVDALGRRNYRRMKLKGENMKIVKRIIGILIRTQVEINEI